MENSVCAFCSGMTRFLYRMKEYDIWQCQKCGTGFVHPMPDASVLHNFYNGFLGHLSVNRSSVMTRHAAKLYKNLGLTKDTNAKMLDVGGGGGFYCKAFEELDYGVSYYLDRDPQSCTFARDELQLSNVIESEALAYCQRSDEQYDFIHCRHVIEHMVDPVGFCDALVKRLNVGGVLLLQCPNGDSLEYLAYWHMNIRQRLSVIKRSNGFSKYRVLWLALSGRLLHGMDPPRHLWAISRKGMRAWMKSRGLSGEVFTRHLGDYAFSPGYSTPVSSKGRLRDFIGQRILANIKGGTHLVAIIQR